MKINDPGLICFWFLSVLDSGKRQKQKKNTFALTDTILYDNRLRSLRVNGKKRLQERHKENK